MTRNSDGVKGANSRSLTNSAIREPDQILYGESIPTSGKVLIIAGSQSATDELSEPGLSLLIDSAIESLPFNPIAVISGGADGVDTFGEKWADKNDLPIARFEPEWDDIDHPDAVVREGQYGKYDAAAGPRRNRWMAEYAKFYAEQGALLALPDLPSSGTESMI
ncbi:SLOG family protein [Halodesulfurarchaeum sp. HSR-GB]|uniref:SLOG family protein n=1 Tax=Halodesulfurarchaeum sp. HSR-GB TaxID=3074077 RepID=UPI0028667683|nr:SLOG family protein [Halodesulfurarchaeum sp. HSR-GB]MDR5657628.1 SLOG family protein [Halodesulfurarchaeum sp. HSR-GB]